jgi:hypothetical protein
MSKLARLPVILSGSALLGFSLLPVAPLAAQKSTTRGLNLGFHLQGASLKVEDADPAGGGGAGFRVGYGFNRIFTLYLEADGVTVEAGDPAVFSGDWTLGHAEIGARFHFANSLRSWVPYLEAAVGSRAARVKDVKSGNQAWEDVNVTGGAFSVGGGIYAYITETLALEVGLKFSSGQFTKVDLGPLSIDDLDIDAQSTRFDVGIVWWP